MNEPTQGQLEEFYEGCGFYVQPDSRYEGWQNLYSPDGTHIITAKPIRPCHYPKLDLNNLWKYAIPQLYKEYRNWCSLLYDWVDQCTGDYEKDTLLLFAQLKLWMESGH